MAQEYRVDTPEVVGIEYPIAGIGSRFLAFFIDILIQVALLAVLGLGAIGLAQLPEPGPTIAAILFLTILFVLYVFWGYFVAFEALWSGQTPGKRVMKIRVIKTSGHPIGFVESAIRNLMRIVDSLPFLYGVGLITMFINQQSRRLGDLAAGTLVVKEYSVVSIRDLEKPAVESQPEKAFVAPLGSNDPEELQWDLRALTAQDLQLAGGYLERSPGFDPEARHRVGEEVATLVANRIGARTPADPSRFLRRVIELREAAS